MVYIRDDGAGHEDGARTIPRKSMNTKSYCVLSCSGRAGLGFRLSIELRLGEFPQPEA
jgi:hypothetical protein